MLGVLIVIMLVAAYLAGGMNSSWKDISAAAVGSCTDAVELGIFLAGSMALWGGLMRIAERSGIASAIGRLLSPLIRRIFKGLNGSDEASKAVSLNLTANLLGLGNAATPTGIKAVRMLDKHRYAKRNTAMLTVLNTASIQLIPVSIGALRAAHGSTSPFEIMPAVLVTSLASAAVGCIFAGVLYGGGDDDEAD